MSVQVNINTTRPQIPPLKRSGSSDSSDTDHNKQTTPNPSFHNIKVYYCHQCGQNFVTPNDLKRHSCTHNVHEQQINEEVNGTEENTDSSSLHMCADCGRCFSDKQELRHHRQMQKKNAKTNRVVCKDGAETIVYHAKVAHIPYASKEDLTVLNQQNTGQIETDSETE
jgi:DNA-directed RNA polymerase subunit RPC12/RpoP